MDIEKWEARNNPVHSRLSTPGIIIDAVAKGFYLTPSDLKGRNREDHIAFARQVAMYIMRQEMDCSLEYIGKELGGRNPSTVSYAYQKIAIMANKSSYLEKKIAAIGAEIKPVDSPWPDTIGIDRFKWPVFNRTLEPGSVFSLSGVKKDAN